MGIHQLLWLIISGSAALSKADAKASGEVIDETKNEIKDDAGGADCSQ